MTKLPTEGLSDPYEPTIVTKSPEDFAEQVRTAALLSKPVTVLQEMDMQGHQTGYTIYNGFYQGSIEYVPTPSANDLPPVAG